MEQDSNEQLEGVVLRVIYKNDGNGFSVFELEGTTDDVVCTGFLHGLTEGEHVKLTGNYVNHNIYGRQFSVSFYEKHMPATIKGIERYLSSGAVKGIGEKLAARIVEKFGKDTLQIIESHPERLAEVNGISVKKAKAICAEFHEQKEQREMLIALSHYGISIAYGMKIYKKYGAGSMEILKKNPYLLCDEISGIGFVRADMIAEKMGIKRDSPYRVKSAVKYVLSDAAAQGHTYLPISVLLDKTEKLVGLNTRDLTENLLQEMQIEREIVCERYKPLSGAKDSIRVFLNFYHYAESFIAKKILELANNAQEDVSSANRTLPEDTPSVMLDPAIQLSQKQIEAVKLALNENVFVLTGGPGTGKTTTLNAIIRALTGEGLNVRLAAPTGRAAKRMTEATGYEAATIHRLLGATGTSGFSFEHTQDYPIEADAIIIDEASMIDVSVMYHLLQAVPNGTKFILTGDANQLPSVGPGNVLRDIIASERITLVTLDTIFRQAETSAIIVGAHKINNGQYPDLNKKKSDFFFITKNTSELCAEEVIRLAGDRLPKYLKTNGLGDIQILTPMRKYETGVHNLNKLLQTALNPPAQHKREKEYFNTLFREGDKVMHIKNNYSLGYVITNAKGAYESEGQGVFNGDIGLIKKIDETAGTLEVVYDSFKYVTYDHATIDELELAYAVTIHKSQGSEYRAVIIPLFAGPPMLMTRNLLNTAVTRAKELVVIVGVPDTMRKMINNNHELKRYTTLAERIAGSPVSRGI